MAFRLVEDGVIRVQYMYGYMYMYRRRGHLERHGETRLIPHHTTSQRREALALPMTMGERYSEDTYTPLATTRGLESLRADNSAVPLVPVTHLTPCRTTTPPGQRRARRPRTTAPRLPPGHAGRPLP